MKISTVNENCRTMGRERNFKIYLNNPSMRAALFNPVRIENSQLIGHLAESAVFSQWQHGGSQHLRYARWRNSGEVDIVYLDPGTQKPQWIGEVKWSDHYAKHAQVETKCLKFLLDKHAGIRTSFLTTRSIRESSILSGRPIEIWPTALYCYMVGKNATYDWRAIALERSVDEAEGER